MVEANPAAEAERHPFTYGRFRTDKPADAGYTPELVHIEVDQAHYDDMNAIPAIDTPVKSVVEIFYNSVKKYGNNKLFGTRPKLADGSFGPYEWMTY